MRAGATGGYATDVVPRGLRSDEMRPYSLHDDVYLGGIRVLVVDDYAPLRAGVAAVLENCGAAVTAVGSAEEAFEAFQRERPDVLVQRPGDAWQGRLLAHRPGSRPATRVGRHRISRGCSSVGFSGPEHRATVLRAGFQYHIEKPVTLENWSRSSGFSHGKPD